MVKHFASERLRERILATKLVRYASNLCKGSASTKTVPVLVRDQEPGIKWLRVFGPERQR